MYILLLLEYIIEAQNNLKITQSPYLHNCKINNDSRNFIPINSIFKVLS